MADTVILGGGGVDGYFGKNPDWSKIKVKTGRTIWSSYDDNTLQAWLVEDTNAGGVELAGGNYANPIQIAGNGLPRIAGYFASGFVFENPNQVGIDASGNSWQYIGTSPLPYTVTAGTVPSAPDYELVFTNNHNNLTNRNAVGAHAALSISLSQGGSAQDALKFLVLEAYGGGEGKTPAENKAALQSAILALDGIAGQIVIPPAINYGFNRIDKSTWPDFSALSSSQNSRIFIDDYSFGVTGGSGRSGAQRRKWTYTGNEIDGQHNGDFEYFRSNWHGGYFASHDANLDDMKVINGGAGANRRMSYFTATEGDANWRFGQGRITDDSATEDELTQFIIAANGLSDLGTTGLTTCYVINKNDGRQGCNTGLPRYAFDFKSRVGQTSGNTFGFEAVEGEPILLMQGETGSVRVAAKPNSGFSIQDGTSFLYDVTANGGIHTLRRNNAGSVNVKLQSFTTQRTLSVNDATSEFRITNAAGASNTMRHTDAGDLIITGAYSPFTGTHLFFSKDKIDEGYAVDLVSSDIVEYIEYIPVEPECVETIVTMPAVKPVRMKLETEEAYNERCSPAYESVRVESVEKDPIKKITKLNGTVELCNQSESRICAGVVEHQVEMEGGYLTFVAAVGDNKTDNLKGFRVTGSVKAGDILCTDFAGKLKIAPDDVNRSVVIFKAMSDSDTESRCYGYFLG